MASFFAQRYRHILLTVCIALFIPAANLSGLPRVQDFLEVDTVVFLDIVDGNPVPLSIRKAKKILADEAAWLVNGMIYGFTFSYRPGDRVRNIEEAFELNPQQEAIDSRQFEMPQFIEGENRLIAKFEYFLRDFEKRRYFSWYSNIVAESQGRGYAPLELGPEGKIEAHKEAIHNALFNYFRTIVANKPQLITGAVSISSSPVSGISGGEHVSSLRIRIRPDKVVEYQKQ